MKKKKTNKKIASALAMLMLSAAMLGTSTYAWFTMNKTVSVTNMRVQAKADQGLLINEVDTATDSNWDELATTSQTEGIKLHATSTKETAAWYAAYSKKKNSAASAAKNSASSDLSGTYKTIGTDTGYIPGTTYTVAAVAGSNAQQDITWIDGDQDNTYDNGEGYYVKYTYYLKSSGDAITCTTSGVGKSLNITDVAVTGNSGSADLDKALRVAIVVNGYAYIYAPLYDDADLPTYFVAAGNYNGTTPLAKETSQPTAMTSIPAVTATGTPVYVYLYFEGEDANLKTDNVTSTLDDLTVNFKFELVDNAAAVTDNGVSTTP